MPRGHSDGRFVIRHEDAHLLVVEKSAGLLTVPTPKGDEANLVDLLRRYLGGPDGPGLAYAAHRLDRPVSGLLVFAKSRDVLEQLIPQFRDHTVQRAYVAAVAGLMREDQGTFEDHLQEQGGSLRVYVSRDGRGLRAVTHWTVRERIEATRTTLVDVELETGQRNQIRVQFAAAGHPLLGERKYLPEGDAKRSSVQGKQRIFLHASRLAFTHPIAKKVMTFDARLPPQLEKWLADLRRTPTRPPGTKKKDRHRDRKNVGKRRKTK